MTPGKFDPSSLALLAPPEARALSERLARALGFSMTSGRSGDGCYVLEGVRGAGSRSEKAVFLVVLEWPVEMPDLDGRRGILFNFAGAGIRSKAWEVVSQEDLVKMAVALKVPLPEEAQKREAPRVPMDPKFLPSVDKLESDMRWGADFLSEGKYAEAIGYFDKVLRSKPGYSEALRLKGQALAGAGDLGGAEKAYRKAIDSSPEDSSLWLGLAGVFSRKGAPKEELACLEKALALNPSNGEAWLARGDALAKRDLLDEAALCFIKADKIANGSAEATARLGAVLVQKGDAEGAEEAFRKALAMDDSSRTARFGLIELLLDNGRPQEAAEEANALTARFPEDQDAWRLRTKALEAEEKAAELQRTLILGPKAGKAEAELAKMRGKDQKAPWLKERGVDAAPAGAVSSGEVSGDDRDGGPSEKGISRKAPARDAPAPGLARQAPAAEAPKTVRTAPAPKTEVPVEEGRPAAPKAVAPEKERKSPAPEAPEPDGAEAAGAKPSKARPAKAGDDEAHSDIDYYWNKMKGGAESAQPTAPTGVKPTAAPRAAPAQKPSGPRAPTAEEMRAFTVAPPAKAAASGDARPAAPPQAVPPSIVQGGGEKPEPAGAKGKEQGLLDDLLRAELGMAKGKKAAKKELAAMRLEAPEPAAKAEDSEAARMAKLRDEYICFGDYDKDDPDCKECDVENECVQNSDDVDVSDEYICFGECDEEEDDCRDCEVKDKCKDRKCADGKGAK